MVECAPDKRRVSAECSAVPGHPPHQAAPQQQPQQPQGLPIATAADLFQPPGRDKRPSRIVVLLRGPPGSGKSAAARKIRTIEQDAGASVRVHSIDDYFVTVTACFAHSCCLPARCGSFHCEVESSYASCR